VAVIYISVARIHIPAYAVRPQTWLGMICDFIFHYILFTTSVIMNNSPLINDTGGCL